MKPVIDRERDLKGATPEALARALMRAKKPLSPSQRIRATADAIEKAETEKGCEP